MQIVNAPINVNPEGDGVERRVQILTFTLKKIFKIPKCMMSDQNPHPGDIRHSQIPVGCLDSPSGLTLIGA